MGAKATTRTQGSFLCLITAPHSSMLLLCASSCTAGARDECVTLLNPVCIVQSPPVRTAVPCFGALPYKRCLRALCCLICTAIGPVVRHWVAMGLCRNVADVSAPTAKAASRAGDASAQGGGCVGDASGEAAATASQAGSMRSGRGVPMSLDRTSAGSEGTASTKHYIHSGQGISAVPTDVSVLCECCAWPRYCVHMSKLPVSSVHHAKSALRVAAVIQRVCALCLGKRGRAYNGASPFLLQASRTDPLPAGG